MPKHTMRLPSFRLLIARPLLQKGLRKNLSVSLCRRTYGIPPGEDIHFGLGTVCLLSLCTIFRE